MVPEGHPLDGPADLTVTDVAERCHVSESTLRMWERRYDFPQPLRDDVGNRRYTADQALEIGAVLRLREAGLSLPAAIDRVLKRHRGPERSLSAELRGDGVHGPLLLSPFAFETLSTALSDEALMRGEAGTVVMGFGRYTAQVGEARWLRLVAGARMALGFGDFPSSRRHQDGWLEIATAASEPLANEYFVVIETATLGLALAAWERPGAGGGVNDPSVEVVWTLAPARVREALIFVMRRAARDLPRDVGPELADLLAQTTPAGDFGDPGVTERVIDYLAVACANPPERCRLAAA